MLWLFQIVILVVDSTDRERLTVTKEELHRMLSHEVQIQLCCFLFVSQLQWDWFGELNKGQFSLNSAST